MTTYLIKPLNAVDLRQNESDGAILVELNGTINADVINADMNAITGEAPNSKTLYDLYNRLIAAPATEAKQDSILAAIGQIPTTTRVVINQNVSGAGVTQLIGDLESNYSYLHALWGTFELAGTIQIRDVDNTALTGPMSFGTNGGWVVPPTKHRALCLRSTLGQGLEIFTTQKFNGFAIVSQATGD